VDLRFADAKHVKGYLCSKCPKAQQKVRCCGEPGFSNLKKPKKVDSHGMEFDFCPGKATWYPVIVVLFEELLVAYHTGLLPKEGTVGDQEDIFTECFPTFVDRWQYRSYYRVWTDVDECIPKVLEAIGKMFGAK